MKLKLLCVAVSLVAATSGYSQTTIVMRESPSASTCTFVANGAGVKLEKPTGNLTATGTFSGVGCAPTVVIPPPVVGCLEPAPGWARLTQAPVYYQSAFQVAGFFDVTQFDSIWGRNYSSPPFPIQFPWPGGAQQLVMPAINNQQYVAARFVTPANDGAGHSFTVDPTSYGLSGGNGIDPTAKLSFTVSRQCGDFDTASLLIPPRCTWSQLASNNTISMAVGPIGAPYCSLRPNTEYFLNVIYAPLTSPASAVFNGFNGAMVTLVQNQVFTQ